MARRVDDWFGAYSAEGEEEQPEEPQPEGEEEQPEREQPEQGQPAEGAAEPGNWDIVQNPRTGQWELRNPYGESSGGTYDLGAIQRRYNDIMGQPNDPLQQSRDPQLAAIEAQMRAMSASRLPQIRLPSMPSMPTVGGLGQLDPQIQLMQQELLRMQLAEQARQAQRTQAWAIARDMMAKEEANRMARGYVSSGYFRDPEAQAWARAREMLR